MAIASLIAETIKSTKEEVVAAIRRPVSVYRLQFSNSFTFRDAAKLVPYLHELGITDCYTSPCFKARTGSLHGYDVSDHNSLNPELGSAKEYDDFVHQLQKYGMGHILDIVPNHMAIFDNPRWQDVLENGPSSVSARFFDIDWQPVKAELHEKVLLPILEDLYGNVLEKGLITLSFELGAFTIDYRSHKLPIGPKTAVTILEQCLMLLRKTLAETHQDFMELQSIVTACRNLPERSETETERMAERHREKEIVKRRLAELYARNKTVKSTIEQVVRSFRGVTGDSGSFRNLHNLMEKQAYRLSYYNVANEEINYRRFFDVNDLVALRMEDPYVFEETHCLIRDLLIKRMVTGLRIDHIDGLFDPYGYLWRLQKAHWLDLAMARARRNKTLSKMDVVVLRKNLQAKLERESENALGSPYVRPIFLIVEKIMGENETLPESLPVDGTTGYEFAVILNQIFVDKRHGRVFCDVYRWFTHVSESFEQIAYRSKKLVMQTSMAAEVNVLAHRLNLISEKSWQNRDFTHNSVRDAIREVIACFPVYRTYIDAYADSIEKRDEGIVHMAIEDAKRHNPAMSFALFDFVENALLLKCPDTVDQANRDEQRLFVMHFQQTTGPIMAKGVEDTAFYIYNPLISMNDVGGYPERFGASVDAFHLHNLQRKQTNPYSFSATSTHDSKRGEDVRARINVLSEITVEWKAALTRWRRLNRSRKTSMNGELVPDSNEEYLIYQTILGTYPVGKVSDARHAEYRNRIRSYMLKALREAKVHTSWISPNASYEEAVDKFVSAILEPSTSNQFLADFGELHNLTSFCGMYNSLSQTVLKLFSPGVPDTYQGNELFALNLTDPDNRRPVDFARCKRFLDALKNRVATDHDIVGLATSLLTDRRDGRAKLYVTWRSLNYRRDNPMLFGEGEYMPLSTTGAKRKHVCAFAWQKGRQQLIVVAPVLLAGLTGGAVRPIGAEIWADTCLLLPPKPRGHGYRNIFTGEAVGVDDKSKGILRLADVLKTFPVAAFVLDNAS